MPYGWVTCRFCEGKNPISENDYFEEDRISCGHCDAFLPVEANEFFEPNLKYLEDEEDRSTEDSPISFQSDLLFPPEPERFWREDLMLCCNVLSEDCDCEISYTFDDVLDWALNSGSEVYAKGSNCTGCVLARTPNCQELWYWLQSWIGLKDKDSKTDPEPLEECVDYEPR